VNSRNDTTVDPEKSTALQLDHRSLLDTVESMWPQIAPIQGARLRDAVRSVPEAEWNRRPRILLAVAASHRSIGSTSRSAALPWLRAVDKSIRADPHTPLDIRAGYLIQLATTLRTLGDQVKAREHLESVRRMLEDDLSADVSARVDLSASFSLQLGLVRIHVGEFDEALFALSLAEGLADEHLSAAERVECHSALAYVSLQLGDFVEAERQVELAVEHAEGTDLLRSQFAALTAVTRFVLLVERAALGADFAGPLRDLRITSRNSDWEPLALYAEALGKHAVGSWIEALDLLGRVTRILAGFTGRLVLETESRILHAESMRNLGELEQSHRALGLLDHGQHHAPCPHRLLALASFRLGDPQAALDALAGCLEAGSLHSARTIAQVYAIASAAHHDLGDSIASAIAFDRALLAAALNGVSWPFRILPAEVLERLLTRAAERFQPAIVTPLIERMHVAPRTDSQPLADPLSERELVIVRHLTTGATLSQIGGELFISVNTVKSHVRSIYRKLSATNRREAIARAEQLGLADD